MKKILLIFLLLFTVFLLGLVVYTQSIKDSEAPVITFEDKEIMYNSEEGQNVLLDDVSAYDAVDGDVSDTLMVESIVPLSENTANVRVTYAAKDKSKNVATKSRIVTIKQ